MPTRSEKGLRPQTPDNLKPNLKKLKIFGAVVARELDKTDDFVCSTQCRECKVGALKRHAMATVLESKSAPKGAPKSQVMKIKLGSQKSYTLLRSKK